MVNKASTNREPRQPSRPKAARGDRWDRRNRRDRRSEPAATATAVQADKCPTAEVDDHTATRRWVASIPKATARTRAQAAIGDRPPSATLSPAVLANIGDIAIQREIAALFVVHTEFWLRDLGEAVDANDPERLRQFAHGLKGSAATVGATALSDLCELVGEFAAEGITDVLAGLCQALALALEQTDCALREFGEQA